MCVFLRFREVFLCGMPFPSCLVVTGVSEADFRHASPYVFRTLRFPVVFFRFCEDFLRLSSCFL
jgi:hypothetical protein